jgi:peptidoglycan/xylan/chitin deacetylase (PgdA/CDA1 family)
MKPFPLRKMAALRPVLTILPIITVAGMMIWAYFSPTAQIFGKIWYEGPGETRAIALSFDDGPNEPYTSQVLDVLVRERVMATFFLVGQNVVLFPETTRRIVREGHAIGNHLDIHDANHSLSLSGQYELDQAQSSITAITGLQPALYRPPHGRKTPWELGYAAERGFQAVNWSITTNEKGETDPEAVARRIIEQAKPGGIILMHDGYGIDHDLPWSDKSLTPRALPFIIKELRSQGYHLVTVPELLSLPANLKGT